MFGNIKSGTIEVKTEIIHLKDYLKKNCWWILFFNLLLLLVWSSWIFDTNPRIDTEHAINTPGDKQGWLLIGRQGLILTRHIFGLEWFNPFLSGCFGYLLICVAGIFAGYLLWRASLKMPSICSAFGLICFTSPIMAEQFYFELQIFEIAWAYILCVSAVGLSYFGVLKKKLWSCIIAILCMVWSFSSYQAFPVLYITMTIACFMLFYRRWTLEEGRKENGYYSLVFSLIGLFAAAFVVNTLITNQFFTDSSYLNQQIFWGKRSFKWIIVNILRHIMRGFCGRGIFYTGFFGVFSVAVIISAICETVRSRTAKTKILYILAVLGLQVCPFLLTIYVGQAPVIRAQLVYPIVIACNIIFLLSQTKIRRTIRVISALMVGIMMWTQAQTTLRLIYTDEIRAREDVYLAEQISQQINSIGATSKPVAFVGTYKNTLNAACIRGDLIGASVFDWDSGVSPHYFYSTKRSRESSRILGIPYKEITEEQLLEARMVALDMPSWPASGSVVDAGDFVVVKLSQDQWESELILYSQE